MNPYREHSPARANLHDALVALAEGRLVDHSWEGEHFDLKEEASPTAATPEAFLQNEAAARKLAAEAACMASPVTLVGSYVA